MITVLAFLAASVATLILVLFGLYPAGIVMLAVAVGLLRKAVRDA